jgi:hypothetical protein
MIWKDRQYDYPAGRIVHSCYQRKDSPFIFTYRPMDCDREDREKYGHDASATISNTSSEKAAPLAARDNVNVPTIMAKLSTAR